MQLPTLSNPITSGDMGGKSERGSNKTFLAISSAKTFHFLGILIDAPQVPLEANTTLFGSTGAVAIG